MDIQLHQKQFDALKALREWPVVLYGGARGGGKSFLVRAWQVMRRLKYPKTRGVIIRKTYPELSANHIDRMWVEYPDLHQFYDKAEKMIRFPNGSSLAFRYLQNPDDVYVYQGLEFEDICLDEAGQHREETFKILRASNRTPLPKKEFHARMLLTGNPGGVGHGWLKRLFIDRKFLDEEDPSDYFFVASSVYDNPTLMENDPDYIKRLKALPEDQRRAYLEGDWDVFVGQFFSEFRKEKHVIKPRFDLRKAPPSWDYVLSWDEGTLSPRAVHVLCQDNDGRIEVIWEYYKKGQTAIEAAQEITSSLEGAGIMELLRRVGRLVYDPSMDIQSNQTGQSTSRIINSYLGMRMEPANNDRIEGARKYREYLHWTELEEPLLRIWDTCPSLIEELPGLVYDERRRGEDIDSGGMDHAYDSTRYGIMALRRTPNRMKRQKLQSLWEQDPFMLTKKKRKILNPITGY